jgi:Tol biopolymer transport system component
MATKARRSTRLTAALCAVIVVAAMTTPAMATFPGRNGRIAFVSDGNLYTILTDGTGTILVAPCDTGKVTHPSWSADGARLVYSSGGRVFTINGDGTQRTDVTAGTWPSFSPDGKSILFEDAGSIQTVGLDGAGLTTVTAGYQPAWSANGQAIVFGRSTATGDSLYSIAPGAPEVQLTNAGTQFRDEAPNVSPDSTRVLFQRADFADVDANGNVSQDLFVVNLDGTAETQLTATPEQENTPSWSPDGARLVFAAGFAEPRAFDLFTSAADGTGPKLLINMGADDVSPDWGVPAPGTRSAVHQPDPAASWLGRFPVRVRDRVLKVVSQQAPQCGSAGRDDITGTPEGEMIFAGAGNDKVNGAGGDDVIVGAEGDDLLLGAAGDDLLFGDAQEENRNNPFVGFFRASLAGGSGGADVLDGGAGNDLSFGGGGNDQTLGKDGKDKLWGGLGNDTTKAGGGNDELYGQQGIDYLDGGPGNDQMRAGDGRDTCVLDNKRDRTTDCEKERRHFRRHF